MVCTLPPLQPDGHVQTQFFCKSCHVAEMLPVTWKHWSLMFLHVLDQPCWCPEFYYLWQAVCMKWFFKKDFLVSNTSQPCCSTLNQLKNSTLSCKEGQLDYVGTALGFDPNSLQYLHSEEEFSRDSGYTSLFYEGKTQSAPKSKTCWEPAEFYIIKYHFMQKSIKTIT